MKVVDFESSLSFMAEDITTHQWFTYHVQKLISHPASLLGKQVLQKLKGKLKHFEPIYHLRDAIKWVREGCAGYDVVVGWVGFEGNRKSWVPLRKVLEDFLKMLKNFIHMAGNQSFKCAGFDLFFLLRITFKNGFLRCCIKSTATFGEGSFSDKHIPLYSSM